MGNWQAEMAALEAAVRQHQQQQQQEQQQEQQGAPVELQAAPQQIFPCDLCAYVGRTKKLLTSHAYNIHKCIDCKPKFECWICPYVSTIKWNVTRHAKETHLGIKRKTGNDPAPAPAPNTSPAPVPAFTRYFCCYRQCRMSFKKADLKQYFFLHLKTLHRLPKNKNWPKGFYKCPKINIYNSV